MRKTKSLPALLAVAFMTMALGCDSTVGLDPTRPTFTKLLVPGACWADDELSTVDFSVMLLNGTDALVPESRLAREFQPVGELLSIDDFGFNKANEDLDTMLPEPAVVVTDAPQDQGKRGVTLGASSLNFDYIGGDAARDKTKLVIMVLDHSASLKGFNPMTMMVDRQYASDRNDQRISFFKQLVELLPSDYLISLVRMNDSLAQVVDCQNLDPCNPEPRVCSTPTRNRDITKCGLNALQYEEDGRTPLNQTLKTVMSSIITPNPQYNPVVVLFTDGLEDGDPSGSIYEPGGAAEMYRNGPNGEPVPIVVFDLQPSRLTTYPTGRSADLANLACQTGGEYIFIDDAGQFTQDPNLPTIAENRLVGVWRLQTTTSMSNLSFEGGGYLLSTELTVTLGDRQRSHALTQSRDMNNIIQDTRLWLYKASGAASEPASTADAGTAGDGTNP